MRLKDKNMNKQKILDQARFTQVGFVVHDIENASRNYAMIFGCEPAEANPNGDYAITKTKVFGEPAPEAASKLAFFNLSDGVQLELIEPNDKPSVWRDHLDKYGEGIHHIAFVVDSIDETVAECEKLGMVLEQEGFYGDGSGKYAYLDAFDLLKCRVELLENFGD